MFMYLFSSKNQRLVHKWTKEHKDILFHANQVLAEYANHNHKEAKKALFILNKVAMDHLMFEDIELYKLLKDKARVDVHTKKLVKVFTRSFKKTKIVLMNFLMHYSKPNVILDDEFLSEFNKILDVVIARIEFEEENLYLILNNK